MAPGSGRDSHTKWTVGLVSVALVSLLAFFASEDYRSKTAMLHAHEQRLSALEAQAAAQRESAKRVEETQMRLEATQLRLEAKVDRLLERVTR